MCSNNNLRIDFKALKEGEKTISATLGDDFFASIEGSEITQGDMHVDVSIRKTTHFSDVRLHTTGIVVIPCDRCLDPMEQEVEAEQRLTVKLGDEYIEEDELITLDENHPVLDLSWFVYESIILNLPVKHVHAPGKCNPAMINILNENSAARSDEKEGEKEIDPRWSKLAGLKFES